MAAWEKTKTSAWVVFKSASGERSRRHSTAAFICSHMSKYLAFWPLNSPRCSPVRCSPLFSGVRWCTVGRSELFNWKKMLSGLKMNQQEHQESSVKTITMNQNLCSLNFCKFACRKTICNLRSSLPAYSPGWDKLSPHHTGRVSPGDLMWFRDDHLTFVFSRGAFTRDKWSQVITQNQLNHLMLRLHVTTRFMKQGVCRSAATLSVQFKVDLPSFYRCYQHKQTLAAHLDEVTNALWLHLNTTAFCCF